MSTFKQSNHYVYGQAMRNLPLVRSKYLYLLLLGLCLGAFETQFLRDTAFNVAHFIQYVVQYLFS
jgi:hypothetical protein